MTRAAALIATTVALTGCGIHNPDAPAPAPPHPNPATGGRQAAPSSTSRAPSASPAGVLTAFASAYASASRTDVEARQRRLMALASPAFANRLRQHAAQAALDAQREMPLGAQLVGRVISSQLGPGATTRHGVVVIQQALTRAGQPLENPFTTVFLAVITRAETGWQIASFVPQP